MADVLGPAVVVITGIMAAGKSTVAQLLTERLPRAAHVRGDLFRRMIVSGRADMTPGAEEEAGGLGVPSPGLAAGPSASLPLSSPESSVAAVAVPAPISSTARIARMSVVRLRPDRRLRAGGGGAAAGCRASGNKPDVGSEGGPYVGP